MLAWRGGTRRRLQGHDQHKRHRSYSIDEQAHSNASAAAAGTANSGSSSKRSKAGMPSGYDLQLLSLFTAEHSAGLTAAGSASCADVALQAQPLLAAQTPTAGAAPPLLHNTPSSSSVEAMAASTTLSGNPVQQQTQAQPAAADAVHPPGAAVVQAPSSSTNPAASAAATATAVATPTAPTISWLQLAAGLPRTSRASAAAGPPTAATAAAGTRRLPPVAPPPTTLRQQSWLAAAQLDPGVASPATQPLRHHASAAGTVNQPCTQQPVCKQTPAAHEQAHGSNTVCLHPPLEAAHYQQPTAQHKEASYVPAGASSSRAGADLVPHLDITCPTRSSKQPSSTQSTTAATAAAITPRAPPGAGAPQQALAGNLDLLMLWGPPQQLHS